MYGGYKFTFPSALRCGESVWRCANHRSCDVKIHTDSEVSKVKVLKARIIHSPIPAEKKFKDMYVLATLCKLMLFLNKKGCFAPEPLSHYFRALLTAGVKRLFSLFSPLL
uniref:FLYWCH-type domain-containing protein n=1 Tax=Cacopsylla melanoneura TaxID=428564 RepID=A0A8D8SEG8_9HEMI